MVRAEQLRPPPPTTHPCPPSRGTWLDELTPGSVCEVSPDGCYYRWSHAIVRKVDAPTAQMPGAVHVLTAAGAEHSMSRDAKNVWKIRPCWGYDADSSTWSIQRDWQMPLPEDFGQSTCNIPWVADIGFEEGDSFEAMLAARARPLLSVNSALYSFAQG